MKLSDFKRDVVLAPFTTYKIGGPADYFVIAKKKEELIEAIRLARQEGIAFFILGTGANILVGDKGFRGLVIKNEADKVIFTKNEVLAQSGVLISHLINLSARRGLSGLEHFAGIPSTLGGALWQNLHFLSPDRRSTVFLSDIFLSALVLDEEGVLSIQEKDFFEFGYDMSILHKRKMVALEARLSLVPEEKSTILAQAKENFLWRSERHPPLESLPSCGSVFKKIEGVGAGRLIEKAGLKGSVIGGAQVSHQHANFIVNTGRATARDIRDMVEMIQEKVRQATGYTLEPEISFVGDF